MKQELLDEIRTAYVDNQNDGRTFEQTQNIRNLDFKASESVSGWNDIEDALKATGEGYNAFEPVSVANRIYEADPEAKVWVAREGSVCLYIETKYKQVMKRALKDADEADTGKGRRGQPAQIRFWWD